MINTTAEKIESIAAAQAEWFRKSDRHDIGFRKESLRKLKSALLKSASIKFAYLKFASIFTASITVSLNVLSFFSKENKMFP